MEQYNYMPIGTVVSYAGVTTPIGWLLCDGSTITELDYPELFKVVGNKLPVINGTDGTISIIKALNVTTDTTSLPIQMSKSLNSKIENNRLSVVDEMNDVAGKEFLSYIQDAGEKTAGKLYRDRITNGLFHCDKTTTITYNSSDYFTDYSNYANGSNVHELNGRWKEFYLDYGDYQTSSVPLPAQSGWKSGYLMVQFVGATGVQTTVPIARVMGECFYNHPSNIDEKPFKNRILYENGAFRSVDSRFVVVRATLEYA